MWRLQEQVEKTSFQKLTRGFEQLGRATAPLQDVLRGAASRAMAVEEADDEGSQKRGSGTTATGSTRRRTSGRPAVETVWSATRHATLSSAVAFALPVA